MNTKVNLDSIYIPSEEIVTREIEGIFIIIPFTFKVGEAEDNIFTLSETGKAIWDKLSDKKRLKSIVKELPLEFDAPEGKIKKDVLGLMEELLKRGMVVESKND